VSAPAKATPAGSSEPHPTCCSAAASATQALRRSQPYRARALLERAVALDPSNKIYRLALERAGQTAPD
jgi:hypothetical protein